MSMHLGSFATASLTLPKVASSRLPAPQLCCTNFSWAPCSRDRARLDAAMSGISCGETHSAQAGAHCFIGRQPPNTNVILSRVGQLYDVVLDSYMPCPECPTQSVHCVPFPPRQLDYPPTQFDGLIQGYTIYSTDREQMRVLSRNYTIRKWRFCSLASYIP